ncbi:MAG: energy transducer TonB [Burkholderiaceae bacterium]|nr:energy transducer TonB [Burkholderiaceae bacterium]
MDFSKRQDDPRRHLLGLSVVIALHVLIVYALVNGLAKKVVDVVRAPIETKLIEEIVKPPPPPPTPPPARVVAPPPRQAPPPPPFVPPPEVIVTAPLPMAPTITAVTPTPPPTHVEITPMPPPPIDPEPAPPPKPAQPVAAAIVCTRMPPPVAPNVAVEVKGSLFVIGTLKNGRVVQVDIERNTLKGVNDRRTLRAFVSAVETAMKDGYVCAGDGVQIRQEFFFDIR